MNNHSMDVKLRAFGKSASLSLIQLHVVGKSVPSRKIYEFSSDSLASVESIR